MKSLKALLFGLFLVILFSQKSQAQTRAKIDEERTGVWYLDKKNLELSEKFKRMDKSYYVGHLYEGSYKYNRASDYLGFKNAIKPLEEALRLIEKEYDYKLKTRTSDIRAFLDVYQTQMDYSWICYLLYECYSNIEQPNEAVRILYKLKSKKQQKDYFVSPHVNMCWIIHRNRFHTSEKYSFLKNTIEANESAALKHLDSALKNVQRNYTINSSIFNPGHEQSDLRSVYFSKTLIYSYNFEMDSAEYYYDLLKGTPSFSNNNYAYTKLMNGEFKEAIRYFELEKAEEDFTRKNTKEFYYMLALLNIYKAQPEKGIKDLHEIIGKLGSTPGFGWNNLGLSRGYYYNGLLFESQKHLKKASEFEEMHIGTTWAPEHYDFTKNVFSYLNKERTLQSIPFENKNYWYNIPTLAKMLGIFVDEQTDKFMLINKFGANPERDFVYYHLFSPENTITFDEVWKIIDGLDVDFFIKKFSEYRQDDDRENIKRYYNYFIAKLLINQKKYEQAEIVLQEVLNDTDIDADHEKLLKARCYEALCTVYEKLNIQNEYKNNLINFYSIYPQLVPFSGHEMYFNLVIENKPSDNKITALMEELKTCNVHFLNETDFDGDYPTALLNFEKVDSTWQVKCQVSDNSGNIIAQQESFRLDDEYGNGKKLAYYMFNIPASTIPNYGDNNYTIIALVFFVILFLWIAYRIKKKSDF